jgi:hypothetical protein
MKHNIEETTEFGVFIANYFNRVVSFTIIILQGRNVLVNIFKFANFILSFFAKDIPSRQLIYESD